ncbi:MAG TPA: hypothetical protein PLT37_08455, partial [Kiritimatiellia bacterium]|nr:hypothetical protein [Kiritimatiellia bacterium]HQG75327.1 hypothetical protein [Kiritimatiellia bacterium]
REKNKNMIDGHPQRSAFLLGFIFFRLASFASLASLALMFSGWFAFFLGGQVERAMGIEPT